MLTGGKVQSNSEDEAAYMKGISKTGIPVYWYRGIQDVPQGKELEHLVTAIASSLHLQFLVTGDMTPAFIMGKKEILHISSYFMYESKMGS